MNFSPSIWTPFGACVYVRAYTALAELILHPSSVHRDSNGTFVIHISSLSPTVESSFLHIRYSIFIAFMKAITVLLSIVSQKFFGISTYYMVKIVM